MTDEKTPLHASKEEEEGEKGDGDDDSAVHSLIPEAAGQIIAPVLEKGNKCLKTTFLVLVAFAVVTNLFIGVVQILPLVYHPIYLQKGGPTFWEIMERIYITFVCLVMIFAEIRVPVPFFKSLALQSFVSRGFLYAFIGNLCFVQSHTLELRQFKLHRGRYFLSWHSVLLFVAGVMGYVIGAIYLGLGIFCFRHIFEYVHSHDSPMNKAGADLHPEKHDDNHHHHHEEEEDRKLPPV